MMNYVECDGCNRKKYRLIRPYPGFEGVDIVECLECGLMQAQPIPTDAFLDDYYKNTFGNSLEKRFTMTQKDEKGYRLRAWHQFNFIHRVFPVDRFEKSSLGPQVLDVGCHAGSLLSLFKERGWGVTGIDPNPRGQYGEKWYGIKISQGLFQKQMFQEASFDLILHSHVLEHVRAPREYLSEFYRILKPGGGVFIEVPNETPSKLTSERIIPHLYFFTPKTLETLAREVGFNVVCTRVLDVSPLKGSVLSRNGFKWLRLRSKARYNAHGKLNVVTFLPFFGRLFKEDRFFKGMEVHAENLRVMLQKPFSRVDHA